MQVSLIWDFRRLIVASGDDTNFADCGLVICFFIQGVSRFLKVDCFLV
jgi:hypothetical protein